jgi:hypothetical protein
MCEFVRMSPDASEYAPDAYESEILFTDSFYQ